MPSTARASLPVITDSTRQVLTLLLRRGPMPRAELARRLSLSPAALTKLTRPLVDIGLLIGVSKREQAAVGRPGTPLAVSPGWGRFAGVKVTGDRLYGVITNLRGSASRTAEAPLASAAVDDVCDLMIDLVNEMADGEAVAGVGVGLAGSVVRAGGHVVTSPFLGWTGVALADRLARRSGRPVSVENDLRALTAGQHWFGDRKSVV